MARSISLEEFNKLEVGKYTKKDINTVYNFLVELMTVVGIEDYHLRVKVIRNGFYTIATEGVQLCIHYDTDRSDDLILDFYHAGATIWYNEFLFKAYEPNRSRLEELVEERR